MKSLHRAIAALLLPFVLFSFSCGKKDTPPPPKVVWQEFKGINDISKIVLNATTDDKKLYLQGAYTVNIIDSQLKTRSMITTSATDVHYDMVPMHSKFFILFAGDKKSFTFNTFDDHGLAWVHVSETDPNLDHFAFSTLSKTYKVGISDEGQVLVPGRDKEGKYHFYLFTFNISSGNDGTSIGARPTSVKKIDVPAMRVEPQQVHSIGNDFFAMNSDIYSLYKIDRNGTVTATIPITPGSELFKYDNKLYLAGGSYISESTDGGNTFTRKYTTGGDLRLYFRVVNDKILVFHPYEGIGLFEFTSTGFTIRPLDLEGLEGNHLTALAYFRGNLYAATLSGLYYKKWEEALK